MTQLLVTNME